MPLQPKDMFVNLFEGINTKTDEKLVSTQLLKSENTRRQKGGALSKRYGYKALGRGIIGSTDTIEKGIRLINYGFRTLTDKW